MICFPAKDGGCWVCGLASCNFTDMEKIDISEKDLKRLGFKVVNVPKKENGDSKFRYYYYDFGQRSMQLISSASDEVQDDKWIIKILDYNNFVFDDLDALQQLIDILKKSSGV